MTAVRVLSSARVRLTLGYALFLVAAGVVVLAGVYVVLHEVPNYPLTAANPRDRPVAPSRQEILGTLLGASGYLLAGLAVIGTVGGWVLAGRVLRPLRHINDAARVAADDLGHRIRLGGPGDEFRQVADSFDTMLDRLQESFAARERFAANASHELRTPLTVTAMLLESAGRDPETRIAPQLFDRLTETNRRSLSLVEALLHLAEADGPAEHRPVDLAEIARTAVDEQAGEAVRAGIAVDTRLEPAPTAGDGTLLAQAVSNLVQNAVRHNVDADGRMRVATGRDAAGRAVCEIENTGARYDHERVQRLREPFLRGAGRVSPGRGHGLGLALADRIVRAHEGDLKVSARPTGGLTVTITLAAPPTPTPRTSRTHEPPAPQA